MRAKWKGKFMFNKSKYPFFYFFEKDGYISKDNVGKRYQLYNGKKFNKLMIKEGMIGEKFGKFILTKLLGKRIHMQKRIKNK